MFPGPTMTSTGGTDSVPYARAAIACAPPIAYTSSTPAAAHAASVAGWTAPSDAGGTHTATDPTPAIFAGSAVIRTVDGYAARPPGT